MTEISFRSLDLYPTQSELFGTSRTPDLQKNIVIGAYDSVEQYLNIHFKLLREDFIAPLRESLLRYRHGEEDLNLDVYTNVTVFSVTSGITRRSFKKFKLASNTINLKETKKFLNGSLLIFSADNFETYCLAKVIHRDQADFEEKEFFMEFVTTSCSGSNFTMIECRNFFEPYYQVMRVLKRMDQSSFPMEKYIIKIDTSKCLPKYLRNSQLYTIDYDHFPANDWSKFPENVSGLNDSQLKALKAALSEELAVIQGPPGTGKTYLGLKIVQILLQNCHLWYRNSPILVISHKNLPLDHFLEGILPFTKKIVRVGGQSKSELLEKYNLNTLAEQEVDLNELFELFDLDNHVFTTKRTDLEVLREALVVGMTTAAAARMKEVLEQLKSPIVIVEEAAEVLEAHVVAALTTDCQHLILLGDHFQLQPSTSDREIGRHYNLGISLFERMVINGITCHKLNIQHRMRPEISKILKLTTYPFLEDHQSVYDKPGILGVEENVFFIDHNHPEEVANVTSKKNIHEAKFVVAFAKYLIQNGYDSSDVTIIATYAGQVREIKRQIKFLKDREWLANVAISTLDGFQGQESEIIILSLVRSEEIGFIVAETRICVAMSRAKNGFYMIGNMGLLSSNSQLWHVIKLCLEKDNAIGSELTFRCQKHPLVATKVKCSEDFRKVACGGCTMKCIGGRFSCGHMCRLFCHVLDHDKYIYKCKEYCQRRICDIHNSGRCSKLCFEKCDECEVKVWKKFPCGHSIMTECSSKSCPLQHA